MADHPSAISGALKRPFAEQVAFFRAKLGNLVPTVAWSDMAGAAHDRGFMVAGAAKADLLTDLAAAVDRSISEGQTLEAFRKDFLSIVERNGWVGFTGDESPARRAWRTRTIYSTNAATSYHAGRYAQLVEGEFPLWVYHHNDAVTYPRPLHVSWNGITLPAGHIFWQTHYTPNGWGCHCYISGARSEAGARRLGGDPDKQLPEGWAAIDPKTGVQVGIDKGWDYAPGASVAAEVGKIAEKTLQWDYQLAKAYMQEMPNRDALARSYRSLPSVADDVRRYAQRILEAQPGRSLSGAEGPPYRTMGLLTEADAHLVNTLGGGEVAGFDYAIDRSAVGHIKRSHGDQASEASRGQRAVTAEDYARLPAVLNGPDTVESGGVSDVGRPVLRYGKEIGGERYTAVFEVRTGRRMLALQSFRIGSP